MEDPSENGRPNGEPMERKKPAVWEEDSVMDDGDLVAVVKGHLWSIFFPEPISDLASTSFLYRIKTCLRRDFPRLRDSSRTAPIRILRWARRGSPLRAVLLLSVGAISLLTLAGLSIFMLFFLTATVNAVVISLLVSLAAAGGFLALFFSCVAAIYIGALSAAIFVISTATISAIIAVLITAVHVISSNIITGSLKKESWHENRLMAGWIGFLWTIWLGLKKSAGLAKHSMSITGSAITAFSARHVHQHGYHHHE